MTSATASRVTGPTCRDVDPFVAPLPTHQIANAPLRSRVVLRGVVVDVRSHRWVGGPVLEVMFWDGAGACLVFLGRRRIPGIEVGRELTVAGTIWSRRGRRVVLNPYYWLHDRTGVVDG